MRAQGISRAFHLSALVAGMLLSAGLLARAGDQGSLEGIVTDPSGAVVPGATLRITDQQRGASFTAASNGDGLFRFPVLPVGIYELAAQHPGFAAWLRKDVEVTVGARINLNVTLLVAGASESAVVRDPAPAVETTRSQVSATVGARSIRNLPVNGRNFLDFVLLTPGVTRGSRGGFDLTFGGQRKMNLLRVDGADDDNTFFTEALGFSASGQAPYQFSMASVQEFQVNTNSYSAELGRAAGGVINVVTRSGNNELHGSAFWYYRDRSTNANNVVNKLNSLPKSPYHFNQFGGTLGGPLLYNRLFFFLTYDGQRSTLTNLVRLNLPAGFALSSDPAVASFQRMALDYLTPRSASWLRTFDQDVVFARGDWRIAPTHLLSGHWNRQRFTGGNQEARPAQQISLERTGASLSSTDTLAVSLLSSLSPSLANTFLFAYVRSREPGFSNSANPEANILEGGQLVLTIGRQPNSPRRNDIDRLQWSDVVSLSRGRHALKFGADVLPNWITFFTAVNFSGSFRFTSLESFGRSVAAAPPVVPDQRRYVQAFSGEATHGVLNHPDFTDYAAFAQDEWRLHPRLTLNLGLRYDLQVIRKPSVRNPSSALPAAGLDTSELRTDTNNLAPRLGLAWSSTDRLVFRAGYGVYFARTPSIITASTYFQNGITVQTRTFVGGTSTASLIPSYPNTICGPPDPSGAPPNCAAPSAGSGNTLLQFFAPRYTQPYTQQGSLGMEFQVKQDWLVSASYLAVKGTHLQRVRDVNLGTPTTLTSIGISGTTTALSYQKFALPRPITGFGRLMLFESAASSIYHALVFTLEKRFSRGFQFSAAYTFSKTIDDNPEPIAVNPGLTDNLLLSDASNPRADRASGVNDQRHRFVFSALWQPRSPAKMRWRPVRVFLSDWEFGGIFTAQTSLPYSAMVSSDLNGDDNSANDRTPGIGRNTFFLPRMISLDPRVTRNIALGERARLQLLAEGFNVFNHANISAVSTTQFAVSNSPAVCGAAGLPCLVPQRTGVNALGAPTATSGPRVLQLAAKIIF